MVKAIKLLRIFFMIVFFIIAALSVLIFRIFFGSSARVSFNITFNPTINCREIGNGKRHCIMYTSCKCLGLYSVMNATPWPIADCYGISYSCKTKQEYVINN